MNSNIEIEAKVLLSEEQYDALVNYLGLEKYRRLKQINYYIDSKDQILRDNEIALRIREKDDFELTFKAPMSEGLLEKNQIISWKDYEKYQTKGLFPAGEIKDFLETLGFKTNELIVLATLETDRINYQIEDCTLCLDKSTYNGKIDYELEMEAPSMKRAEALIDKILKEVGIKDYTFNKLSKQSRALNEVIK